jgi:MFS family permease
MFLLTNPVMTKDNPLKDKRKKSLEYSIKDGTAFSVMTGFGEQYFSPLAIELGASNLWISLIVSLPLFIAALTQLYTSKAMKVFRSRRKMITTFVLFQAIVWIPLALIPLIRPQNSVEILILFVTLYFSFGQFVAPVWNSLIGDLVSEEARGRFFGKRNLITGASAFISLFAAGFILGLYSKETVFIGFALIFSVAFIARLVSWYYLGKTEDPPALHEHEGGFSFIEYLRKLRETNYGRFALYYGFMNYAVYIASPFFAVYILRNLHMSYLEYTIITASAALATFIPMTYWGKLADRFGNKKILTFCGICMPLIPVLWLFSNNLIYLIAIQFFAGFVWAGFNLSTVNFVYDNVKPANRTKVFSYHNVLTGTSIFLGAVTGAVLATELPASLLFPSNLLLIFLISGVLRAAAALIFLPLIKEKRAVEQITDREFFLKYNGTGPMMGLTFRVVTGLQKSIKGKKWDIDG